MRVCEITRLAEEGAAEFGWDYGDIVEAVLALTSKHFYKTMESERMPGMWQDVYHMEFRGIWLYIKLQLGVNGRAFVVQFKEVRVVTETDTCPLCGGPAKLVDELRSLRMGDRPVTFMDRFYRCGRCGEEFFHGEMMDDSLRRATAVIRAEDGLLAPDEVVALRKKYGLTQAQLERLIGAGPKTVVRWERGTVCQNRTADTLLRVLLEHPEVVASLKSRTASPSPPRRRTSATGTRKAKSRAATVRS